MCCAAEESIDHLLLHCSTASQLWSLVFSTFGLALVQPGSVVSVLRSCYGGRVGKRRRKAWTFAPLCLMWIIWLERNRRMFRDLFVSTVRLKSWLVSVYFAVMGVELDLSFFLDFVDGLAV